MRKFLVTFLILLTFAGFGVPNFARAVTDAKFNQYMGRQPTTQTELDQFNKNPDLYRDDFTTMKNISKGTVLGIGSGGVWPTPEQVAIFENVTPGVLSGSAVSNMAKFYDQFKRFPASADEYSTYLQDPQKYIDTFNALSPNGNWTTPEKAVAATKSAAPDTCSASHMLVCLKQAGYWLIDLIGNFILSIAAKILWVCAVMFNLSLDYFVVHMKTQVGHITAIYSVWQTVRDLANMFFIFILLVIALQTILQIGSYKKTLRNVILVALFINFSFFFTGAMIDASNLLALQFYNGFATNANASDGGVSGTIRDRLKLGTIYSPGGTTGTNAPLSSEMSVPGFLITVFFGSALMIIAGGIFIASSILIVYRFIELIMLLMFSPLAFTMIVLPGMKKYWSKWWDKLVTQLVFAPVYFMFLWVTMKVIQSNVLGVKSDMTWVGGFGGDGNTIFGLVVNYIIVIAMLIYSLTLAKELGAGGISVATSASKGFQSFFGRQTIGRASSRIANSQFMQNTVANHPFLGRLVQKPFDSGAKLSFGGKKGGFDQAEKDSIKQKEDMAKRLGPSTLMTAEANAKLTQASTEHDEAKKAHEKEIQDASSSFEPQEKALSTRETDVDKGIEETQGKITAAEETVARLSSTGVISPQITAQIAAATKEATDNKAKLVTLQGDKTKVGSDRTALENAKQNAIDLATAKTKVRVANAKAAQDRAQKEKDVVVGVKEDEAKKRADKMADKKGFADTEEGKKQRQVFRDRVIRDNGLDRDEVIKEGEAKNLGGQGLEKWVQAQIDANKGIAKNRQEQFAEKVEGKNYGAPLSNLATAVSEKISDKVPGRTGKVLGYVAGLPGRALGGMINAGFNHTTRMAEGAGIRKNVIKEKSAGQQFEELAKKMAKADSEREGGKPEGGGDTKEKPGKSEGGGEAKSKS